MNLPRSLRLGPLWLKLYHTPVGRVRDSLRMGGPFAQRSIEAGRQAMVEAAGSLPPLPVPAEDSPTLHLLTGARFWYQTAFCLHSFVQAAGRPIRAEIYDDGSLAGPSKDKLVRLGSAVRIHSKSEIDQRVEKALPKAEFPVLHERRMNYPNIRKLIDVHAGTRGWKLVIDSDLLFFRRPDCLLAWLQDPIRSLHAVDCSESYGYSRPLLESLAGSSIPPLVNVGLCGWKSDMLDWKQIESWCGQLIAKEGTNYYLEQALFALMAAGGPCEVAPAKDYVTRPSKAEVMHPRAVMHHYVAESKRWYFTQGWRNVPLKSGGST